MNASVTPTSAGPAAPAPRWGVQSSLIQPHQPAFWLFLGLLGIGGYVFADEQSLFSQLPTALTLSWGLVLLYAVPVFLIVYRLDLFEREPRLMLAAALLWGGVVAASLAGYANDAWLSVLGKVTPADFTSDWGAAVVAPFTEETLKLTGVVILFLIAPAEFDGVMDGFVYGALIGLGFTVVEDVSYFIHATVAFGGADQTGPVVDTFLIRVIAGGLYSHVLFAGLTGMGFAYFVTRSTATYSKRLLVFVALVAAGAGAHFVWDSPWMLTVLNVAPGTDKPSTVQWIEYGALKGLPFFILLAVMVVLATRSEEKNFRAIVAPEPDRQILTEAEITALGSLWSRRAARTAAGRIRGPQGSRLTGQLQAAQIEFAMILSRSDSLTDPALESQRMKIRTIRAQLEGVQFVPVAAGPGMPAAGAIGAPSAPVWAPPAQAAQTWAAGVPAVPAAAPAAAPAVPAAAPATVVVAHAEVSSVASPKAEPEAATENAAAQPAQPQPRPEPAAAPAPIPSAPPAPPAWTPTHLVPPGGMAAWNAPDPSRPSMLNLPERLQLVVDSRAGAWAHVRAVNGWHGWVDGRRLIDRG